LSHQKQEIPMKWSQLLDRNQVDASLVWFGLVWFGLVWFGLVWFGLVWSKAFSFLYLEANINFVAGLESLL
jgi:uncharacterized membrane protein